MNCIKKITYVIALLCMTTGVAWGMDIFYAARLGNTARVSELLAAVPNADRPALVNQTDINGWTALHAAARYGHEAVVRLLIAAGANIDQASNNGRPPLHMAASEGLVQMLNDYQQRIEQARQRVPVIAHTLALATHPRLGTASPLALLPQELLRYITRLTARAEEVDARKPR